MAKNPIMSLVKQGSPLSKTLEFIIEAPRTSREIAEFLEKTQRYANMVIKDLIDIGVVRREKDRVVAVEAAKAVMALVRAIPELVESIVATEVSRINNGHSKKRKRSKGRKKNKENDEATKNITSLDVLTE